MSSAPALNRWGEPVPQEGEIWKDAYGHSNLIVDTFEDDGECYASLIDLNTGDRWEHESFNCWTDPHDDGTPFYRTLVG